jgi:hypothetical protein
LPIRFSAGTTTSLKKHCEKPLFPVIWISGATSMPGVFMSIKRNPMPSCLSALGSVRTRQKIQSARCACDVQVFCPFTRYLSPRSSAVVRRFARSEPAPGSE